MFSEELNKLIEAAFVDGVLTDKERTVIMKRAIAEGNDPDEIELLLNSELQKRLSVKSKKSGRSINLLIDEINQIETKYINHKEEHVSQKSNEIVSVIRKFPIPQSLDDLIDFVKSIKNIWLDTSTDGRYKDIRTAYKTKYLDSLQAARSLYPDSPIINKLYCQEEKEKKGFHWKRMSGEKQALVILIPIAMILILPPLLFKGCDSQEDNSVVYETYQEAARAHDFEAAHKILDKMLEDYHKMEVTPYSNSWFSTNKRHKKELAEKEEMLKAYKEGVDYVFDAEALYLCSIGDKTSQDRLSFLMSELKIVGNPISDGVYYNYFDLSYSDMKKHKEYISSVSEYNSKCDKLLDLAIANHNLGLASHVILLYKPIPNQLKSETKEQIMSYSNGDKEIAITKVNKAIDSGTFPNVTEHIK